MFDSATQKRDSDRTRLCLNGVNGYDCEEAHAEACSMQGWALNSVTGVIIKYCCANTSDVLRMVRLAVSVWKQESGEGALPNRYSGSEDRRVGPGGLQIGRGCGGQVA